MTYTINLNKPVLTAHICGIPVTSFTGSKDFLKKTNYNHNESSTQKYSTLGRVQFPTFQSYTAE